MATLYSKAKLSGSTDGKGIKVAATGTPGTLIHTAVAGVVNWDEIWLYAYNSDSVARTLTIEFGDNTAPDHNIVLTISPGIGLVPVIPGLILQNGATVKAFASATNVITLTGFVNQITT